MQISDIPSHSISNTDIITKNFEISSKHNHTMKRLTEKILESIPKSYRKHTHLLMKYLFRKAVPIYIYIYRIIDRNIDRISWDEHGIMTIDGNVVKDLNIIDLINDAMRERKL